MSLSMCHDVDNRPSSTQLQNQPSYGTCDHGDSKDRYQKRRCVVWNTYRECDAHARCSASHLSLIQPSVLAFTPPGTRILRMTTAALNTMTAPTISSIWFSTWRHHGPPYRLYRLDVRCAVLDRTAHDLRGACSSALGCAQSGTDVLHVVCLCTREQCRSALGPYTCNVQLEICQRSRCDGLGLGGVCRRRWPCGSSFNSYEE